eukprot:660711-Prymnesium_polylepis.1
MVASVRRAALGVMSTLDYADQTGGGHGSDAMAASDREVNERESELREAREESAETWSQQVLEQGCATPT